MNDDYIVIQTKAHPGYKGRHLYPRYRFNRGGDWTHQYREYAVSLAWVFIAAGLGVIVGFISAVNYYGQEYPWDLSPRPSPTFVPLRTTPPSGISPSGTPSTPMQPTTWIPLTSTPSPGLTPCVGDCSRTPR